MEMFAFILLIGFGLIIPPIILTIMGVVGGFVIAKVVQRAMPNITNSDVAAITLGWAKGFGLGGVVAALFFGIAFAGLFGWTYLMTGICMTIGLAIVGGFAGEYGAKPMFQRLMKLAITSESSAHT